ncbi:unnamed protein product [Soboliphyme baturini]|uniref:Nesprin-1-like n=1 Tax=Soboliphyme baturini TaxID=241478 RepID=A0A183J9K7_9BILA|nr:unnamed protein product [Soboliphyme baturini]
MSIVEQFSKNKSCKEVAESFVEQINQLSKQADSLVNCSPDSTEASLLETRITSLQELLSELKETILSKEKLLQSADDKLKTYTDTSNELRAWLEDTEELMANQKSPSSDHRVLKAQLEEQKLVEKLIDDKCPQIAKFKDLVDEVCLNLKDETEKAKVHEVQDEITSR